MEKRAPLDLSMSFYSYTPVQLESKVALYIRYLEQIIDKLQRDILNYSKKLKRRMNLKNMKKSINQISVS